jgi:Tfp pilus assembly protein PilV
MSNIAFMKRMKKNEAGFTFIELLIATVMSLAILGLLAHLFRAQQKDFATQTGLNTMQANGRAATEFISRSVQNAGFNVQRGTRFLSASDHYLTAVYDANNDNVIQNDEVITYALANTWSGTADESHSFVARFDVNGNGTVQSSENPTMTVGMTTTAPPFNLYKVTPNTAGTGVIRSLVARNIDNMVIKYYDRDGKLLPRMIDTSSPPDGIGDTALDADDDGIPDSGNWTYAFTAAELNDIRKVEIDVIARSRKTNPRELHRSGTYPQGSLAAVTSGSTNYNDPYMREDFTAHMAPRNLILAPWGSVAMVANPATVGCGGTSAVTGTLLDTNGDAIVGSTINFTATGTTTGVAVSSIAETSDSNGEGTTTLSYDFSTPSFVSTISGSGLVDNGSGEMKPIYSAIPVGFSFGTGGGFVDGFDGLQTVAWADLTPGLTFDIDASGGAGTEFFKSSEAAGTPVGVLNGCASWQDYSVQTNFQLNGAPVNSETMGIILRHQDDLNYYWVRVRHQGGSSNYHLEIGKTVAGTPTTLTVGTVTKNTTHTDVGAGGTGIVFTPSTVYTLKAQVIGNDIRAKLWQPADSTDPNADEPGHWSLPRIPTPGTDTAATDTDFTSGAFGLFSMNPAIEFDNVTTENAEPIS